MLGYGVEGSIVGPYIPLDGAVGIVALGSPARPRGCASHYENRTHRGQPVHATASGADSGSSPTSWRQLLGTTPVNKSG